MKIIIDGDAQPVKEDIIKAGKKNGIEVVVVMSVAHFSEKPGLKEAQVIIVDNRKQETDIKIMNLAVQGDITVTNDTGLGVFLAGKGVHVINSRGRILSEKDLDAKMQELHIEKRIRRSKKGKPAKIKGPKTYTEEDKERVLQALNKIINSNK